MGLFFDAETGDAETGLSDASVKGWRPAMVRCSPRFLIPMDRVELPKLVDLSDQTGEERVGRRIELCPCDRFAWP